MKCKVHIETIRIENDEYRHTSFGNPLVTFQCGEESEDCIVELAVIMKYGTMILATHEWRMRIHGETLFVISKAGNYWNVFVKTYSLRAPNQHDPEVQVPVQGQRRVRTR